jgi:hypothetical protein
VLDEGGNSQHPVRSPAQTPVSGLDASKIIGVIRECQAEDRLDLGADRYLVL